MSRGKAVIFCASSSTVDPKYNEVARAATAAVCRAGFDIVSGGGAKGTMDVVANEASRHGCRNIGIIPRFMEQYLQPDLTEVVWTDTMSVRKELMREETVLALALPGGIGTLDELAETLCLAKLGKYPGRVVALDAFGFYQPFKALLDHYVRENMMDEQDTKLIDYPRTVAELEEILKSI